jgi:hypothetical protein
MKVVDIKQTPEKTNLAAAVEPKLAEARTRLAHCNAALAASLEEPGAAKQLNDLNARMDAARRDVSQLEQALRMGVSLSAEFINQFWAEPIGSPPVSVSLTKGPPPRRVV